VPRKLSLGQKKAAADRVAYYREMGIHDFYKRDVSAAPAATEDIETVAVVTASPELPPVLQDPVAALELIRQDIGADCKRCKLAKLGRKQIVFGVGNPRADLMFVGEGPGADEDEQGEPFVGRAGQLLNKMIEAMGINRSDVYIANVVKCRPPSNRIPEKDECDTCSPFLMRQIDTIRPKAIVALGATAAKALLQLNESMATMRSRTYEFRGSRLFVTYHPAYLLRDPRQKVETWKDLQQVMKFLGMAMPAKKD